MAREHETVIGLLSPSYRSEDHTYSVKVVLHFVKSIVPLIWPKFGYLIKVYSVKLQLYEKDTQQDKVTLELMLETCKRKLKEKERFSENLEEML